MEIYSVSEITRKIRHVLEFQVGEVWVEGEVSNLRRQQSGHRYFTLKDDKSQLSCVFFAGDARRSGVEVRDGQRLRAFGEITVYQARGQYQLIVRSVREGGVGGLHERFEALKNRLRAEGLFAAERKKPLPKFPARIAIVTSPTGAALQDMLHVLRRRAPWVRVYVCPVRVQGEGAHREMIAALRYLESSAAPAVDAVILARGGGSLEDLWNFNEEELARAMDSFSLPLVSGVGHETDFTIADFVADGRAPTPSAAAELVTPDREELLRRLEKLSNQLGRMCRDRLAAWEERLRWLRRSGAFSEPERLLREQSMALDGLVERLGTAVERDLSDHGRRVDEAAVILRLLRPGVVLERMEQCLAASRDRLDELTALRLERWTERCRQLQSRLRGLGPDSVLARGFSVVTDDSGKVVRSSQALAAGDRVRVRFHEGEAAMRVEETDESSFRGA